MENPPTGNGVRFPISLPESSLALANIATLTRKAPNGMSPGEHRAMYFDPESSFWASIEVVTHNAVRKPTVEEITRWTQQGVLREVFPYLNVRCDLMPQIHEVLTKTRIPEGTSNRVMSADIRTFEPTIQRIAAGALYVHLAKHRCKVLWAARRDGLVTPSRVLRADRRSQQPARSGVTVQDARTLVTSAHSG
jgi:hypothetical protein